MEDKLSAILNRGKIQSEEEHDIVFKDWEKRMYSGASADDLFQHNKLLIAWKVEQDDDE